MFSRIIIFLVCSAAGYYCLTNSRQITNIAGPAGWAEHKFGPGGTYTMWKIIGILIWIFGFIYLLGKWDDILRGIISMFV
jgi:hypothetical protein